MAGKVSGKTSGVGSDITDLLEAVAEHFNKDIKVTSGKRNADEQAQAMFDNWIDLDRGAVYKTSTLPVSDRTKLDEYYQTAVEKKDASNSDKAKAKKSFLDLAKSKVGSKSKHATGRAVDVQKSGVNTGMYKAITTYMDEVKEGDRDDIYHFESDSKVPQITDKMKESWGK
jgi:hypothetical protein